MEIELTSADVIELLEGQVIYKTDYVYDSRGQQVRIYMDRNMDRQEWIEERAAIIEYYAGFDRRVAEEMAEKLWNEQYGNIDSAVPRSEPSQSQSGSLED